jgi:phosphatidate cytidylyltransferase
MRVVSAALLLALVLSTIWYLPIWGTMLLAAIAAWLAADEVAQMATHADADVPRVFVGAVAAAVVIAVPAAAWPWTGDGLRSVLLALIVAGGALTLRRGPHPSTLARAAVTIMAPLYVGLPLGAIAWIQHAHGPAATTWLLAMIAASDSAQYYCGRTFGRRKLAPAVSPAKTVEGAVGGVAITTIVGALTASWALPGVSMAAAAALTLALALAGIVGDLFESLLKRSVGVKDSSSLIPGHGGVLDRIDSHLFAAPVFYSFLRFIA